MTERFDATTTTTCGYCGVGCKLEAHRVGGRIISISPAMDGPANKGHTCVKGRFAHQFSRSRDRLTSPLVRESGGFRLASWEEALTRVAEGLGRVKAEHGPDAIAGLASSRATNEDCYVMQRMMRAAIGTHNIDNCSRVCHSPTSFALRKSFGLSGATGSFDDIEATDVALIIGANPTQGHPVVGARIKQAALNGVKLITADPRRIELADYGVLHLGNRPGTNSALLNGLAHVVIRDGLVDRDFVASRTEGYDETAELVAAYTPAAVQEITGVPAARPRARRPHLRGGRQRLHPLGTRRDRAPLRLRGRAPDLQPRVADRQRRARGRGSAAAARPEQRAGLLRHGRAAGHVHRLPPGHRRRRQRDLRGALGRDDEARARHEDPRDVRRRRRRQPQGDVHLRGGRRPDRPEHQARRGGARVARLPRLPGHLRDRDHQVRRRGPARLVVPREDRHVHQRRAPRAARPRRGRAARRRPDGLRDPDVGLGRPSATTWATRPRPT